jgi:carboxy-terminal domain RNA polymerase II polypeptide A small phosphatase
MKKLLILDLDETLIYGSEKETAEKADLILEQIKVYKRPYFEDFLLKAAKDYKIAIWSSGSAAYVEAIAVQLIKPLVETEFVWSRERCTYKRDLKYDEYYFLKDLGKVKRKGYSLKQVLIVDNTPRKTSKHYGNAIYVKDFINDKNDDELKYLSIYLQKIKDVENVRQIEKRGWRSSVQKK